MKPSTRKPRKSKRTLKVGLAILGTLILGAIGSGIWARIGEPLANLFTSAVINGINLIWSNYKDLIYIQASSGFREYAANELYQIFIVTLAMVYVLLIIFHPWLTDRYPAGALRKRTEKFFRSGRGFLLGGIFMFAVLSSCVVLFTQISYVNRVITYAHKSIDRLAPFLTDQEKKELLAEFRSVNSAEDYYKFYDKLLKLYSDHGIDHRSVRPL